MQNYRRENGVSSHGLKTCGFPRRELYEKNWLKIVCDPFHNKVGYVMKEYLSNNDSEFIAISIDGDEDVLFPNFAEGTQFKNLETDKKYSLQELGVLYDK